MVGYLEIICGSATLVGMGIFRRYNNIIHACTLVSLLSKVKNLEDSNKLTRVAITGATKGIGLACAEMLCKYRGVELVLGCRDIHAGTRLAESIAKLSPNGVQPIVLEIDCRDLQSSSRFATSLSQRWWSTKCELEGTDIVLCNAGIFRGLSLDMWNVNLLTPIVLSHLLTNERKSRAISGRDFCFVNVCSRLEKGSSMSSDSVQKMADNAIAGQAKPNSSYADTKRGLLHYTGYVAKQNSRDSKVSFVAVTPGIVNSDLGRSSVPAPLWSLSAPLRWLLMRHPVEGAASVLWSAMGIKGTGFYSYDTAVLEDLTVSRDLEVGRKLEKIALDALEHSKNLEVK